MSAEPGTSTVLALILITALALGSLACARADTTAPIEEVLNTNPHEGSGVSWPESGMAATDVSWRFLTLDATGVRGTYNITWLNQTETPTKVWWELSFVDSNGFEVDRYQLDDFTTIVEPGVSRVVSGSFTLDDVTSIALANSISQMDLRAAFQSHDLTVSTETLSDGVLGEFYSESLDASGGDGPSSWSIRSGSLPTGLSLTSSTGSILGTATSVGTSTFAVQVSSGWQTAMRELSITIWDVVTIVSVQPKTGITGEVYADTLTATGGNGVYTWSVVFGTLPSGLSLSPSGIVSGTPTARARNLVRFAVFSAGSAASAAVFVVAIDQPQITSSVLSNGRTGLPYTEQLAMTGGDGLSFNNAWSLVSGDLPPGLSLSGSGRISGTPTQAGTWTFRVSVTVYGVSAEGDITITIQ